MQDNSSVKTKVCLSCRLSFIFHLLHFKLTPPKNEWWDKLNNRKVLYMHVSSRLYVAIQIHHSILIPKVIHMGMDTALKIQCIIK